ncbi:MAG: universal stress protein [Bacillota bacterium]
MFKKILVPVDGSKASLKAYDYAKEIATKFEAEITLIHVKHTFDQPFYYQSGYDLEDVDVDEMIKKYEKESDYPENFLNAIGNKIMDNAKKYFEDTDVEIATEILQGRPAHKIIEFAENNDFDVIVMCTHGMSIPRRFTLGSITNKVVHNSKIPVFITREEE